MSRILLVDDDVSLLKLMSMRLRSQGYEVDTADSAEGALDRLRQQRADLVLAICGWLAWTVWRCSSGSRPSGWVCR